MGEDVPFRRTMEVKNRNGLKSQSRGLPRNSDLGHGGHKGERTDGPVSSPGGVRFWKSTHPRIPARLEPDTPCYTLCYSSPSRQKDLVSLILNLFIILYFTVINIYCPLNKTTLEIKTRAAAKAVLKREVHSDKCLHQQTREISDKHLTCQGMRKRRINEAQSL